MWLQRRHAPLLFLLLHAQSPIAAQSLPNSDSNLVPRDANPAADAATLLSHSSVSRHVGTKDAPVDGRDGMPHEGPWVQTGAERERKKTQTGGSDSASRPLGGLVSDQHIEGDIPVTNDGVMDDPNRLGPKEGTRGTEGGVSEKSKDSILTSKVPGPPKAAPPLPHSEEEKIREMDGTEYLKSQDDEERRLLEVSALIPSNSPKLLMSHTETD